MINLAISMPGKFYLEAITKALEKTGNFRILTMDEKKDGRLIKEGMPFAAKPDVVLLGVSVLQGFTLEERQSVIKKVRERAPNCKIVLFLDEVVSKEQTEGVKSLKQVRLIDGFLYASGTMEYLVATLESI